MLSNRQACIGFTLAREGGFVNNPRDPGGATNMGITRETLSQWYQRPASIDEVYNMTVSVARSIYQSWYWNIVAGDALPAGVDLMVFDMGVNSGCHEAVVELQTVIGYNSTPDGHVGPITLGLLAGLSSLSIVKSLAEAQAARYRSLPGFSTFGEGWMNRTQLRTGAALDMAA